jgi:hypothetical protein
MHRTLIVPGCLALSLAPCALAVPVIANGDLTGPVAISDVPPGWFTWQQTPDTADALGPFNNTPTPWTASPNGGTFVRAGGVSYAGGSEAIGQHVAGFTPGVSYTIDFYQTNLGFKNTSLGTWIGSDGFWELMIDGVLAGASSPLTKPAAEADPIVWFADSITFVAPAASLEIALVSRSGEVLAAYMGIDGVTIREVPTPGVLCVLGVGLAGVRRRR